MTTNSIWSRSTHGSPGANSVALIVERLITAVPKPTFKMNSQRQQILDSLVANKQVRGKNTIANLMSDENLEILAKKWMPRG